MKKDYEIQWRRIFAEGTAIVASILLAFAIDAWWDDRKEHLKAEELLNALESEWLADAGRIDNHLIAYDTAMSAMIAVLSAHASDGFNVSPEKAADLLHSARRVSTYKPSTGAYKVLLAYGLIHIENPELRLAVASWQSVLDEIAPEQEALHQLFLFDSRILRAQKAHDFERIWQGQSGADEWFGVESRDMAMALINDHEHAVILRHQLNLLSSYRRQLENAKQILDRNIEYLSRRTAR